MHKTFQIGKPSAFLRVYVFQKRTPEVGLLTDPKLEDVQPLPFHLVRVIKVASTERQKDWGTGVGVQCCFDPSPC